MLPNVIFGEYESLVRSAPWNRHPTTAELKQICANLRVCTFRGLPLPDIKLIFVQESGVLGFGESVIDTKLQMFWDTFTWMILKSHSTAPPRLLIRYVNLICYFIQLILPLAYMLDHPCSRRSEQSQVTSDQL